MYNNVYETSVLAFNLLLGQALHMKTKIVVFVLISVINAVFPLVCLWYLNIRS